MDLTKNLMTFHSRIDTAVKNMLKDGKIDQYDIPELLLLIADLQTTSMTDEDLRIAITELYEYIMTHYKLFPEDEIPLWQTVLTGVCRLSEEHVRNLKWSEERAILSGGGLPLDQGAGPSEATAEGDK